PVIPIVVRVDDAGRKSIGLLQTGLSLDRLSAYMDRIPVGQGGRASLLTREGVILTSADRRQILTTMTDRGNEALAAGREGRGASAVATESEGGKIFAAAAPIPSLGWIAQVVVPWDEAIAPFFGGLARGGLVGIAVLAIGVAVSIAAARYASAALVPLY